ncbi:MAG: hypothetical protein UW24_C0011G0008 [Parcubacteria group bacterium GW2011_GWA2_44_12]|nr:MAG: hypothetical protein UW24_C0011G0008 [Parcubacteria group bacterium GW2011_GWA2_44_12]
MRAFFHITGILACAFSLEYAYTVASLTFYFNNAVYQNTFAQEFVTRGAPVFFKRVVHEEAIYSVTLLQYTTTYSAVKKSRASCYTHAHHLFLP